MVELEKPFAYKRLEIDANISRIERENRKLLQQKHEILKQLRKNESTRIHLEQEKRTLTNQELKEQ